MLKQFLESYKKHLPPIYKSIPNTLETHPNLIVHHPIIAYSSTQSQHPSNIRIRTTQDCQILKKGLKVLMASAGESFTSSQLVGATKKEEEEFDKIFEAAKKKYEILDNLEIMYFFKIIIQVYANNVDLDSDKQMPLRYFSNQIINDAYPQDSMTKKLLLDFNFEKYKSQILSPHLRNIIESNSKLTSILYQILFENFVKVSNENEFSNVLKLVRFQSREVVETPEISTQYSLNKWIEQGKLQVLSPFLPSIGLSNEPNCVFVGKYFTHLRRFMYSLEAIKDIQPDEELTVGYKAGSSNYDKLLRYGYKSIVSHPENPYNHYIMGVNMGDPDIEEVQEIMSGNMNIKNKLLKEFNLKMRNLVRIDNNGQINVEDLWLFRILFGVSNPDLVQEEELPIDKKIYSFINKFVINALKMHENQRLHLKEIETSTDPILKSIRIIEKGEIDILDNFTKIHNKKTSTLI